MKYNNGIPHEELPEDDPRLEYDLKYQSMVTDHHASKRFAHLQVLSMVSSQIGL